MQIKTTMRHPPTLVRIAAFKKKVTGARKDVKRRESLHVVRNADYHSHCGKSHRKRKMEFPHDPAILLLGRYAQRKYNLLMGETTATPCLVQYYVQSSQKRGAIWTHQLTSKERTCGAYANLHTHVCISKHRSYTHTHHRRETIALTWTLTFLYNSKST